MTIAVITKKESCFASCTKEPRLAIVLSHPVQYYSPLFKALAKAIKLKVFYCFNPTSSQQGKDGFGISFKWDIDLLEGYENEFLKNVSLSPSSSVSSGCDTPEIGKSIENFGATHVVTFGWHLKSYHQALDYCKSNSIPIAVRGDSKKDNSQSYIKRILKNIYYPFFLNRYDAFLSVGQENRKYLKSFSISEDKIIFSPHAVDQDFWSGEMKKKDKFVFIWVAKFIPLKRPNDVIDAFLKLYDERQDVELRMVGTGPLLDACRIAASFCDAIKFMGFQNQLDLRDQYLESDVLVLSSDSETWGLVVNEAFSIGLRVIVSSEVGCAGDLISENTGFVYKVADVEELYSTMRLMVLHRNSKKTKKELQEINSLYSISRNILSFKTFLTEY